MRSKNKNNNKVLHVDKWTNTKEGNRFFFYTQRKKEEEEDNINRINNTLIKFNSVVELVVVQMAVAEWMVLDV